MPRYVSAGDTVASLVRVMVFALTETICHVPLRLPFASRMRTQCPAKYGGTLAARLVTSVAPELPLCAVPEPSDGSSVACVLAVGWLLLLMVRLPKVAPGPLRRMEPEP